MTTQEAREIINQLALATRFRTKPEDEDKTAKEFAMWMDGLRNVPYETAQEAVRRGIESGKFRFMPTLVEFLGYLREMSGEGVPNAISTTTPVTRVEPYAIWRQDQMVAMTEEAYWQYLHDEAYKAETERRWREQWEQLRGRSA